MSIANTYNEKVKIIYDFVSKLSNDEKSILLHKMIKDDIKIFFDTIFEERKHMEKEAGIEDVVYYEENTSDKYWHDEEEAGKVSKEAENAYYFDSKKKQGNDKFDGWLGYVNASGDGGEK